MNEKEIRRYFEQDKDYLVALRRHFHTHPELPRKEFATAEKICSELRSFGLEPKLVGETGVYCEIAGLAVPDGKAKTIVLRADIDALPIEEMHECSYTSVNKGAMHACGHDAHTAALLGAAKFLASHRELFSGSVRLCFQQAEEIGYGGRLFVDGGYLDGADRSFGIHVASSIPCGKVSLTPGPNNASVDWFRINVKGKSAHISTPEKGIDALYIMSHIIVALQSAVTLMSNPTDSLLIGVGKMEAGTAYNIIADTARAEGTIRAMYPSSRAKAKKCVEDIAKGCALQFGAEVNIEWNDNTSALINDLESSLEAQKVATALFGEENVIKDRKFELGGDDFAEFIIKVPGVYGYVGTSNPNIPETCVAQHNCRYDIDEDALIVAASLHAAYAVAFLSGKV